MYTRTSWRQLPGGRKAHVHPHVPSPKPSLSFSGQALTPSRYLPLSLPRFLPWPPLPPTSQEVREVSSGSIDPTGKEFKILSRACLPQTAHVREAAPGALEDTCETIPETSNAASERSDASLYRWTNLRSEPFHVLNCMRAGKMKVMAEGGGKLMYAMGTGGEEGVCRVVEAGQLGKEGCEGGCGWGM